MQSVLLLQDDKKQLHAELDQQTVSNKTLQQELTDSEREVINLKQQQQAASKAHQVMQTMLRWQ